MKTKTPEDTPGREAMGGSSMPREISSGFFLWGEGDHMKRIEYGQGFLLESPFPIVTEEPVLWGHEGERLNLTKQHKAIVDERTGKVFSIVSKDYKVIRHEAAIVKVEEAINQVKDLRKYNIRTFFYNEGGRMLREYTFEGPKVAIQPGDLVKPTLYLRNSYDLSWPLEVYLGALRLACKNGLVIGVKFFKFRTRHIQAIENLPLKYEIATALKRFSKQADVWKKWTEIRLTRRDHDNVMEIMAIGDRAMEDIRDRMNQQSRGWDPKGFPIISLWVFFNILTWYITHRAASLNHRMEMEGRLRRAIMNFRSR